MQPEVVSALVEAANLLLIGMIVVFSFLSMLIAAIRLIAWLNKQFPESSSNMPDDNANSHVAVRGANENVSPRMVAAISAAIKQHRK